MLGFRQVLTHILRDFLSPDSNSKTIASDTRVHLQV